jgi:glycosyltransferase involved in cell wall biosynthesis
MVAYANYFTDARIKNYVDALLRHGFDVDVLALGPGDDTPPPGLRFFSMAEKHWSDRPGGYVLAQLRFLFWATWRLAILGAREPYQFVHIHNMPNFLVFCALVPRLKGARVILDVHDTMPEAYATKFDLELASPVIAFLRWEEKISAAFADLVITTNTLHKTVLEEHGIPPGKIAIIMNVGNERIFVPSAHKEHGKELRLVYHGTIAERLGIDLILRAMTLARKRCPEIHLALIGEGDYVGRTKELVAECGLLDAVELRGFLPVEELPAELRKADVGIIGNRAYTESRKNYMLPVKMLEYAALEIPTIVPRLKSITSYFDEHSAVFYDADDVCGLAERIVEVCQDRSVLERVTLGLRRFNRQYNWAGMEQHYMELVGDLTAGGR